MKDFYPLDRYEFLEVIKLRFSMFSKYPDNKIRFNTNKRSILNVQVFQLDNMQLFIYSNNIFSLLFL